MKRVLLIAAIAASAGFAQTPQTPKKANEKPAPTQKQDQVKEETTPQTDYVCGMTVDPKTAEGIVKAMVLEGKEPPPGSKIYMDVGIGTLKAKESAE